MIIDNYKNSCQTQSDIFNHLPILFKYASKCKHVTEFGTRNVVSSWAYAYAKVEKIILYDIINNEFIDNFIKICENENIEVIFKKENTKHVNIENTDLLFIDTLHTYEQVKHELKNYKNVNKYIILHDTKTFGNIDYDGNGIGIKPAITEFLETNKDWDIIYDTEINNGLIVLRNKKNVPDEDNKLLIGIPILGNSELLNTALHSLVDNTKQYTLQFFFINNTQNNNDRKKLFNIFDNFDCEVFDLKHNIGVSCSWNRIIFNALKKNKTPYIMSSDLVFKENMDKVFDFSENNVDKMILIHAYNFFSVNANIIREIGWFDENIYPAYTEDNDYSFRIRNNMGDYFIQNKQPSVVIEHLGSQTLLNESSDKKMIEFIKNRQQKFIYNYYNLKWGGNPGHEIFKNPFNF